MSSTDQLGISGTDQLPWKYGKAVPWPGDKARPVTAEIRVQFQASVCKILVDDVTLGQVFLRVLRLYPVSVIRQWSVHTPFFR